MKGSPIWCPPNWMSLSTHFSPAEGRLLRHRTPDGAIVSGVQSRNHSQWTAQKHSERCDRCVRSVLLERKTKWNSLSSSSFCGLLSVRAMTSDQLVSTSGTVVSRCPDRTFRPDRWWTCRWSSTIDRNPNITPCSPTLFSSTTLTKLILQSKD